jgi:putative transposase
MPRRDIQFVKGAYYHIYNRGCNRENILFDNESYEFLIRKFRKHGYKYGANFIAYCLMPNHYHLLLRQEGDIPLNEFIKKVFNSYSKAINISMNRTGTLFEGKFKAVAVDNTNYLVHLCRYIHRNPLEAKLVADIEGWKYSNYLEWIGKRNDELVDKEFIGWYFKSGQEYRNFVIDYKSTKEMDKEFERYLTGE